MIQIKIKPEKIKLGEEEALTINIVNAGSYECKDLGVLFKFSEEILPLDRPRILIPRIGAHSEFTKEINVVGKKKGVYPQKIDLTYRDNNGNAHINHEKVNIEIVDVPLENEKAPSGTIPKIKIEYPNIPELYEETFGRLEIRLSNHGNETAKNIIVEIQGPISGEKWQKIPDLDPDRSYDARFSIKPIGKGIIKLKGKARYSDTEGRKKYIVEKECWVKVESKITSREKGILQKVIVQGDYISGGKTELGSDNIIYRSNIGVKKNEQKNSENAISIGNKRCPYCGNIIDANQWICPNCRKEIVGNR